MANPILLPRQGQSVESCIITEFYVKPGDKVSVDTPLFAYETDKASFEEVAKEEGTLLAWFFEEGDEVPVLTNVGVIGAEGDSVDEFRPGGEDAKNADDTTVESSSQETSAEANAEVEGKAEADVSAAKHTTGDAEEMEASPKEPSSGKIFISPRARNIASDKGIAIASIKGSGPNGRIIASDVEHAIAQQPAKTPLAQKMIKEEGMAAKNEGTGIGQKVTSADLAPSNTVYDQDSEIVPLTNIRKLIANAMHQSLQNSAQLTHHLGADARRILELRQKVKAAQNEGYEHNITLNDMVCMAVIRTLKKYKNANAHFLGDKTRVFNKVHLGLAVDTERGLMVPAIKNADDLSIEGLSSQMKAVANACRTGSVDPDLLSPEAASFTVSNLGNYGVEMFTPVINLPQVAILGVNTILPRPKDLGNGMYGFVPHIGLSLTYDHRALDGGEATRFLKSIADEIESLTINI